MKSKFEIFIIYSAYIIVSIIYIIAWVILIGVALGSIAMGIYCSVKFGNMPIQEVPSWASCFMFGGRK